MLLNTEATGNRQLEGAPRAVKESLWDAALQWRPATLGINNTDDQQHLLNATVLVVSMATTLGKAQELRDSGLLRRLSAALREAPPMTAEHSKRRQTLQQQLQGLMG
jgi:hypothetical protein